MFSLKWEAQSWYNPGADLFGWRIEVYSAEISRANPSCILFLVDRSGSMADKFGNAEANTSKADQVATIVNRFLQNLVVKCAKAEGVRDYFEVGVIGYGNAVGFAFGGALDGAGLVPVSRVASSPLRVEERNRKIDDGAGGLIEQTVKFPVWFDAVARGGTPMCQALQLAQPALQDFLSRHPTCYPPVVINITDGESTDGDPSSTADALQSLGGADGQVLLFNVHCSSRAGAPIQFPGDEAALPDQFAQLLFKISSPLTEKMQAAARAAGISASETARGFTFNADPVALIQFLDIGTQGGELR